MPLTTCCPECGCAEFKQAFDGERECAKCQQSWYADVDYFSPAKPLNPVAEQL